jgi:hypothetical protein
MKPVMQSTRWLPASAARDSSVQRWTRCAWLLAALPLACPLGAVAAGGGYWLRLEDVRPQPQPQPKPKPNPTPQTEAPAKAQDTPSVPGTPSAGAEPEPVPGVRWEAVRNSISGSAYSGDRSLSHVGGIGVAALNTSGKARTELGRLAWNGSAMAQSRSRSESPYRGGVVRELNWQAPLGDSVDLRVGRLLPAWGRADGINPTDNLSPRDYTQLGSEADDMRFGNEGAQLTVSLPGGNDSLGAWVFPRGASNRVSLPAQAGLSYRVDGPGDDGLWAFKWDHSGPGLDASLSYVDGTDLMPDVRLVGLSAAGAVVALGNARQQVLGADLSVQDGPRVWRAEAAWTRPGSPAGLLPVKRPSLWLVGGPEWSRAAWTVGVQGVLQQVSGWQSLGQGGTVGVGREVAAWQARLANQTAPRQRGLTLRVAHRALNDALLSELGVLALWPQGQPDTRQAQGMVRGKVEYALDDLWSLKAGFDAPFGPAHSLMGLWRDNRLVYLQVRYSL